MWGSEIAKEGWFNENICKKKKSNLVVIFKLIAYKGYKNKH